MTRIEWRKLERAKEEAAPILRSKGTRLNEYQYDVNVENDKCENVKLVKKTKGTGRGEPNNITKDS